MVDLDRLKYSRIGVVGLGYVGLPLAVELSKKYVVVGFDISVSRIKELNNNYDRTLEINREILQMVNNASNDRITGLHCTNTIEDIRDCNIFIITVPTPVNDDYRPDLTLLYKACETIGSVLKKGDIVIFESTVYPGATEEECVPILQKTSGLTYNVDFFAGYSPERINPGDKEHTVSKIMKVTSGSTPEVAEFVDQLYQTVITAGTFKASSIKVAEASKVIENTQRDINIAFVNELSKIFGLIGVDTNDVLKAAGTKWNFLRFKPGLVGGHCIGVAPYYIAQKAIDAGYNPEFILAGRRLNNSMGLYVADEVTKLMLRKGLHLAKSKVLILGFTFKENCPDIRNTRVIDIIKQLETYHLDVVLHDPWADPGEVQEVYGISCSNKLPDGERFDAVILAVAHKEFEMINIRDYVNDESVVYDVKGVLSTDFADARL
ncbi:nucleotide sugar dehydrogenase [Mucilaginibacter xinganensis]|uniref:UDP-N-acetyl-D-glucosamine 6-dehydrogenase n=1 Tax=Mucilaginibacter xinganensis TaxID=1234841 RepID=A0A223NZ94_9SPHI|nr:nucleotide sugar dehydrogenase [Mucilaginibacter xinganensis]ASU35146.1 UDP-N-acetyl-D-glucosamine 6-dehydrogenase [Mucilaginibacter xinganensis]